MKTLVIMPTFNEALSLGFSIAALRKENLPVDLLIVDDNSPDGTGEIAESYANQNTFVLHRKSKQGLGFAYLDGFDWARARGYDTVVEMDADGSHLASDLQKILIALGNADLAIGSRWVNGGAVQNWPAHRKAISKIGNLYARTILGTGINDMTSGFRAFKLSFLNQLDLSGVASRGYAFQVEMALRVSRAGGAIVEVPITFVEREHGVSKMTTAIVLEALWLVTKWGIYKSA
jgi:dolichol-phosphate mannosyltransferase